MHAGEQSPAGRKSILPSHYPGLLHMELMTFLLPQFPSWEKLFIVTIESVSGHFQFPISE